MTLWDESQAAARAVIEEAEAAFDREVAALRGELSFVASERDRALAELAACQATPPPVPDVSDQSFAERLIRHVEDAIPGLVHAYAMNDVDGAYDWVGDLDGATHGGVTFTDRAHFDGTGHIEIPNDPSLSVDATGALTIVANVAITDWRGKGGNGEYIHWAGKGEAGAHEYAFRHYVGGSTKGEAPQRQGRVSFYHFNLEGGLGAGSYVQEGMPTDAHWYAGACAAGGSTAMWRDGKLIDWDLLSGYNISPKHGSAPLRIGTRDGSTGHLVGSVGPVLIFNRLLLPAEHAVIASFA